MTYVSWLSDTPQSEWPMQASNLHYPSPPPSAFDYTRNEDAPVGLLRLSLARCPRAPRLVTSSARCPIARHQPREAKVTTPDRDTGDHTALHKAASRGHYSLVQSLIENGADPSARDITGRTALHEAASAGHEAVIRLLLDKGADLLAQDNNRCTALHEAASAGHGAVTRLLLGKGADIPAQDSNLSTQLHRTTPGDYTGAVKLLLEDTHLSAQDNQQTALRFTAFKSHDAVIQWLTGGSDVFYSQDSEGQTALQGAASEGHGAAELLEGRPTQNQDLGSLEFLRQLYTRSYVVSGDSPSQKRSCFSDDDILDFDSMTDDWAEDGGEGELEEEGGEREVDLGEEEEEGFSDDDDGSSFGYSSDQGDTKNSGSCATEGKGKGKRIADVSREDGEGQDLSAKRAKKDKTNRQDIRAKEITKPFVRSSSTQGLTGGRPRPYACPYFKYNAREYQRCAMWNNPSIDRLRYVLPSLSHLSDVLTTTLITREHSIKCHLKPIQCLNCGIYRAGDNGRMSTHHLLGNCERAAEIIPIDHDVIVKGEYLNQGGLSWEQIYKILFPECPEECIPSPCKTIHGVELFSHSRGRAPLVSFTK